LHSENYATRRKEKRGGHKGAADVAENTGGMHELDP